MDFQNAEKDQTSDSSDMASLRFLEEEGLDLLASFKSISDANVRRALAKLVHDIAVMPPH